MPDGPETFPTTPRASRGVRAAVLLLGVAGIALAAQTTLTSLQWIGRVFPGFVLLDNRVIASLRLTYHPFESWGLFGEYAYSNNSSEFSTYEYTDNQFMFGVERPIVSARSEIGQQAGGFQGLCHRL